MMILKELYVEKKIFVFAQTSGKAPAKKAEGVKAFFSKQKGNLESRVLP